MGTFFIMLKKVILFVLLAVPGYILVKTKVLDKKQSVVLSKVLSFVGMPFLIITGTLKVSFTPDLLKNLVLSAIFGVVLTFLMFFISDPLTRKEKDEKKRGMARFSMIFPNNGFLGIPLAAAVFGTDSHVFMYLIILNVFNNLMIFTLGAYLISGDKKAIQLKKILLNPVLIGFVVGILFKGLRIPSFLPEAVEYSTHYNNIVAPISMLVLGMKMAGVEMKKLFTTPSLYFVSAMKLVVFPIFAVAFMFLLRLVMPVSNDMIMGFFIAFAISTAALGAVFADQYDGDSEGATVYTLGSTVLSVISIPVLYSILCSIL